jgi:hypothetical protein
MRTHPSYRRVPREGRNLVGHKPSAFKGLDPRLRGEDGLGDGEGFFLLFRVPRAGGDPDPFTQTDRSPHTQPHTKG